MTTLTDEVIAGMFVAAQSNDLPAVPSYNVCPTQDLAVLVSEDGLRRLRPMRWGFLPPWYKTPNDGPLIINARAETVAAKPAFRDAVRLRRCVIPASGFFEWTEGAGKARLPWYITRADGQPLALAGLWQTWERDGQSIATCAIVTTAAGPDMARLHHREPVTLGPADWPLWLGEAGPGAAPLMVAQPQGTFAMHRVDPSVNSSRAQGADLILPVAA